MLGERPEPSVDGPAMAHPAASLADIAAKHYRTAWLRVAILHQPRRTHNATTGRDSANLQMCRYFPCVSSSTT